MNLEDEELVRRVKAGQPAAFDGLMERYEQRVISMAYRMLGQREDALELAQDVFLRAWRGLPRFREEASFRTWLYQITLNLVRNRRRWYARHRCSATLSLDASADPEGNEEGAPSLAESTADPAPGPREEAERAVLHRRLQRALGDLPLELRTVVVLRDIEGYPYEQIASICREPVGTVKSRLHRGRALLRERMEKAA